MSVITLFYILLTVINNLALMGRAPRSRLAGAGFKPP
jgi:hypothetical protein